MDNKLEKYDALMLPVVLGTQLYSYITSKQGEQDIYIGTLVRETPAHVWMKPRFFSKFNRGEHQVTYIEGEKYQTNSWEEPFRIANTCMLLPIPTETLEEANEQGRLHSADWTKA